jgi:hypothetical protein
MTILRLSAYKAKLYTWFQGGLNVVGWTQTDGHVEHPLSLEESDMTQKKPGIYLERQLGETELSYYLPSRGDGVNDMYLELGGRVNPSLIERERVRLVWAIMRLSHPLLASKVCMHDYDDVRFIYEWSGDSEAILSSADKSLEFRSQSTDDLIHTYLNGPRILSNERLSCLIVNAPGAVHPASDSSELVDCDFFFCAVHFLGDGMALHAFANDFFTLLGSEKTLVDLSKMLEEELVTHTSLKYLPNCLEDRLPPPSGTRFQRAARRVDFLRNAEKDIGGHAFPRRSGSPRKTLVQYKSFDVERTKSILKVCKTQGVSISSALFAVCNLAWARTSNNSPELPTLMYTAINVRPNLVKEAALHDSYWFLAIGYFNVVLPSFVPASKDLAPTFWHRSREAKKQSTAAMKTPMLASRCREMAHERRERAQTFARQDDGKPVEPVKKTESLFGGASGRAPSKALIGLSLLGNLDGVYKHSKFPGIQLHTLCSGSRQRGGGMLLFCFTFAGKLWINLGYDENGFDKTVVEKFWENAFHVIDEYMP